jgi:hypothetical protein
VLPRKKINQENLKCIDKQQRQMRGKEHSEKRRKWRRRRLAWHACIFFGLGPTTMTMAAGKE